jgi:hexulose-6-phosphate isomerase
LRLFLRENREDTGIVNEGLDYQHNTAIQMKRREFAEKTVLSAVALSSLPYLGVSQTAGVAARSNKKGIMWGNIGYGKTILEKFQAAKVAGFEGVEVVSHLNREEVLKAKEITGLTVPSVYGYGKYSLTDPDEKVRALAVEALKVTLEDAEKYGADTILLVPGRVNETVSYDACWERSVSGIKMALPYAEKLGITIAIENVWNNFLLSPLEAARYIDQFNSPFVRAYFDCGNVLVIGWPEQWIHILGKRIARILIKEFSRKIADKQGKWAGFGVALQEGDNNWPVIINALDEIGYKSWATIEQPGGDNPEGLKELYNRLTSILAIQP